MGTSAEIQRPLGPRAPQRVQKTTSSHYKMKTMACQACYARKKRCVVAPAQSRCTYCCTEGQDCVPRERQVRTQTQASSPGSPHGLNLPLPHGIDHEVPRWAAVYSLFSEMLRLIPPEVNCDGEYDSHNDTNYQQDQKDNTAGRENGLPSDAISVTNPTNEDVKMPYNEHLASGFSLGELDALLRF